MWVLFVLSLYLLQITHAQLTSAPSSAPVLPACRVAPYASSCQFCEVGNIAILGAPNATANPLQDIRLGPYSLVIRVGRHQSDFSASQLIELGTGTGTIYLGSISPTVVAQTIAMGLGATTINIGSLSTTFLASQTINLGIGTQTINIGTVAPSIIGTMTINIGATAATTAQNLRIGQGSPSVAVGSGTFHSSQSLSLGIGSASILIGWQGPTTQPTQQIFFGTATGQINIGSPVAYSGQAISMGLGSGTVTIGSSGPTANPAQTINVGNFAGVLNLGNSALSIQMGVTNANAVVIGINTGATSGQPVSVGTRAFSLEFGTLAGTINIGVQQSSLQVTNIGFTPSPSPTPTAPTLAPSSTSSPINLNGRYHGFYSAGCKTQAGGDANPYSGSMLCIYDIQGNVPATPTPTPGSTTFGYTYSPSTSPTPLSQNRFYPTQVGHWMFHVTAMISGAASGSAGSQGFIRLYYGNPGTIVATALKDSNAGLNTYITQSLSIGLTFNSIGTDQYVYIECEDCEMLYTPRYSKFIAYRAA